VTPPPPDNRERLAALVAAGTVRLRIEGLPGTPAPLPPDGESLADRVAGMLLGLAVGDALGRSSEGLSPAARRARHGEVRDYLPSQYAGGREVGCPSDDTQLAFWTVEHLLEQGGLEPERLAGLFAWREIYGIGQTVMRWKIRFRAGRGTFAAAQPSAGNGALMRIAPVLLPHLPRPSPALWADAALAAAMTHDDPASTAACVAYVELLWQLLCGERPELDAELVAPFCARMAAVEGPDTRYRRRVGDDGYEGPMAPWVEAEVSAAMAGGEATREACERWYSGAYLMEALPAALLVLARHGDDPEEAIVRAVNDTRDNDTVAAIVGAAVGARHGREALPERWLRGLLGRTARDDDGRVFELVRGAVERWC
jgi:ADP-ribosyl-[dinitrogen reductase] hydrolase